MMTWKEMWGFEDPEGNARKAERKLKRKFYRDCTFLPLWAAERNDRIRRGLDPCTLPPVAATAETRTVAEDGSSTTTVRVFVVRLEI